MGQGSGSGWATAPAGRFWAEGFARALSLPATRPGVVIEQFEEVGTVHAVVAGGGAICEVGVEVRPMAAPARARWLRALGRPPDGPCPPPADPAVRKAAQALGLSPLPTPAEIDGACACGRCAPARFCPHVQSVLLAMAERIAHDPDRLWRWRGLDRPPTASDGVAFGPPRILPRAALARRGRVRLRRRRKGRKAVAVEGATLADYGLGPPAPAPEEHAPAEPWRDEPRALSLLGPLPYAHGQADAARAVERIWAEMRDLCAAFLARRGKPTRPRSG